MLGIAVISLGTAATLFGWFLVGWGSLLITGTALVAVDLWRRGLSPRPATLTTGGGLAAGGFMWGVLRLIGVGGPDQYDDFRQPPLLADGCHLTRGIIFAIVSI